MASGRIILPIAEPILLASGEPDSGATLSIYTNGLTSGTLASLFSDSGLGTPIANPQTSDSAGRFYDQTTVIWADSSMAYGCVVALSDGSSLSYPNIYVLGAATNVSGFAPINSPTFTGVPQAPTPATNDNSNKIATTAYVQAQGYAQLNSPALTGTPTAPTAAGGTNTTQLATTAFVTSAISSAGTSGAFKSGNITITPASNGSVSHGFGVNPSRVQCMLICTSAINGYAIGDMVPVNYIHDQAGDHGPQAWIVNDSTTCKYQFPGSTVLIPNTSGVGFNATSSNFVMQVWAWK
jgi:hypothetical protein